MARIYVAWRNPNWLLPFSCNVRLTGSATKASAVSEHFRVGVTGREKCHPGSASRCATAGCDTVFRSPPQWIIEVHLPKRVPKNADVYWGFAGQEILSLEGTKDTCICLCIV